MCSAVRRPSSWDTTWRVDGRRSCRRWSSSAEKTGLALLLGTEELEEDDDNEDDDVVVDVELVGDEGGRGGAKTCELNVLMPPLAESSDEDEAELEDAGDEAL